MYYSKNRTKDEKKMLKKFTADLKKEFTGYNSAKLSKDLMAGLTVAAVALPLALAFGVSSGADAASGMITAIFAGIITGLLGGASYQISGPTGAMSAILLTLSAQYGIGGVLLAGFLSGALLILAALLKVGKLVSYIPAPVITGFTSGIAVIIALGQIDNFFGTASEGSSAIAKLISYGRLGFSPNWWAVLFGGLVVLIMMVYPKKLNAIVPSSLAGIIIACVLNFILNPDSAASKVAEVGNIPQSLMTSNSLLLSGFDFSNITKLIMPAISIAALGMIESLLCGASAGKMKGEKLDASRELVAQGIGNMVIPLFGGVPATAAIARTSVAIKSGGQTRMVSVFHSITLLLSMFLLGGVMSRIPLAALAGVLMVTAIRMNEWASIRKFFSHKSYTAIGQFLITMISTVLFDLTVAIVIGIVAAMLFFVIKSCHLEIVVSDVHMEKLSGLGLTGNYKGTRVVYLTGPLFFGTQDRLTEALQELREVDTIIFSMRGVPSVDDSAVAELSHLHQEFRTKGVQLLFCGVQPQVKSKFDQEGFTHALGEACFYWDVLSAIQTIEEYEESYADIPLTAE